MPPKSEYSDKLPNPFSVRLSKTAMKGLSKLRRTTGLSEGDMVEWLIRETDSLKVVARNRPGDLTERLSFRVSETGDTVLRDVMKSNDASGGDVVEAYILRAVS
jgi:bifunctional DNA-binding transcriptional regulator/antitoxin component of YhaV-PrlF toxin-antitoxin module